MRVRFVSTIALIAAVAILPVTAQEKPAAAPPAAEKPAAAPRRIPPPVPLKVTVVLSRYQGEKRLASMPYVIGVMASGWGAGPKTTLRMGVDVPVATSGAAASTFNYRSVGTNIDCGASFDEATPGIFQIGLTVSDSSLSLDSGRKPAAATGIAPDMPSFRNFNSSFTALLRDGQTMQYTSATDPVTGELMKIDVTLALMK
jgi:hypothetical protein